MLENAENRLNPGPLGAKQERHPLFCVAPLDVEYELLE